MSTAAKVRAEKEAHPERFCADSRCLWRVATRAGSRPCPTHAAPVPAVVPVPATPAPEDGGCDVCDDPNCYRNHPAEPGAVDTAFESFWLGQFGIE